MLLLLMTLLASGGITIITGNRDVNFSLNDLFAFADQYAHVKLTPISLKEYLDALRASKQETQRDSPAPWFQQQELPLSARIQSDRIRLIVAKCKAEDGICISQYICYASGPGAWIIINTFPDKLSRIQHLIVLHEIGHSTVVASGTRRYINTNWHRMMWAAPFIALKINPSHTQALIIIILTLAWIAIELANQRAFKAKVRLYDEISADLFAFARCDPRWFKDYPATSEMIARKICEAEGGNTPSSEEEVRQRIRIFIENFDRMRQGRPLHTLRELLPEPKSFSYANAILISILIICGITHVPLTAGRLGILGAATLVVCALGLIVTMVQSLQVYLADDVLGVKQMDPKLFDILVRGAALRKKVKDSVFKGPSDSQDNTM